MTELEQNQRITEEICETGRLNGATFHRGEWIALLDGKVVAVAPDLAGALSGLRTLDADPKRGMIFQVGPPVIDFVR